ncbi:MAG TPA: LacI family DNA-binding transcriptional regulator [Rectinemataceae bacterium]|nr:LacI family DNA-binding transcriptional regulator [Rectinemataceae bacterium]
MAKSGITIDTVADEAGVSISTISRWLNTPERVGLETGTRIKDTIDRLGYIPHGNTGSRLDRAVGRIGVLIPFFYSPSFVERLKGMTTVLHRENFELVLYTVDTPARLKAYLSSIPLSKRLDGLVIMSMAIPEADMNRLEAVGLKVVTIEYSCPRFSCVEADNRGGGRLAAELFTRKGYLPAAFMGERRTPPYSLEPSRLRFEGFADELARTGAAPRPEHVVYADLSVEDAKKEARELLSSPSRPRAIFAMSDIHAIGILLAASEMGLRVPQDIAVVGFDDIEAASYMKLSTVSQSLQESGRLAAETLVAKIREPQRARQSIQLSIQLVERETT